MNQYLGELAALATSFLFSATSTFFTLAGQRVGSLVLNRMRLIVGVLLVTGAHLLFGIPLPFQAGAERWFWLTISGVLGLVLGDAFLFQSFVLIGTRLSMLMMALHPAIVTVLARLFLGEVLSAWQLVAITITLGGIMLVVTDRKDISSKGGVDRRRYYLGILCGLGGAVGQALGLITAKPGLAGDFPALSATLIRMLAAMVVLWGYTILRGQARGTFEKVAGQPRAGLFILIGGFTGPFLGVTMSLYAIQNAQVGVASTLMALTPVILLPVGYFVFGERFGGRAVFGTLLAVVGVALLFVF